ncbi:uncharacterized protein LOC143869092 [Tasmannia lanceolata]|uniref:uncharacterized protein LOC143869092 n=1 Tax=Tasmannia lanceolata TaxID=3420 RepID=UPI004062C7D0
MAREFDAIVFGASGFTGQYVVEEMAISMEDEGLYKRDNLKWAVAGRNKEKIQKVLNEVAGITKFDWVKQVPIIEAQVDDYPSILEMCKRTRLMITTVGPFRFFGEPIVKACVEAATDYVDVSGEPQFLEGMQLKYYNEAKKKGCYIVSASGWDSIPADMGTTWTKKQFQGDLSGVEIIVDGKSTDEGPMLNFGTWHSAIYGYACANELRPLRQKLYRDILPPPPSKSKHPLQRRPFLTYIDEVKGYCLPFPGCDKTVVRRSEVLKYNTLKERPLYCETYFRIGTIFKAIMLMMVMSVFGVMAKFSAGRYMLKTYPGVFSFGAVSKEGVPRKALERRTFSHTIIAYGWDEKLEDVDRQHEEAPKKKLITRVSGPDPGYIGTSRLLVHAGMTLLFDRSALPAPGVITPGACFRDTYLVDRLAKRDVKFEVLQRF